MPMWQRQRTEWDEFTESLEPGHYLAICKGVTKDPVKVVKGTTEVYFWIFEFEAVVDGGVKGGTSSFWIRCDKNGELDESRETGFDSGKKWWDLLDGLRVSRDPGPVRESDLLHCPAKIRVDKGKGNPSIWRIHAVGEADEEKALQYLNKWYPVS